MVSFRGPKKAWATHRSVYFRGLIQNSRRASPPLSYEEYSPGLKHTRCSNVAAPLEIWGAR